MDTGEVGKLNDSIKKNQDILRALKSNGIKEIDISFFSNDKYNKYQTFIEYEPIKNMIVHQLIMQYEKEISEAKKKIIKIIK